ncbi:MAG: RluA family pseudouridine synthase [Candidatus Methylacidiphilales bacterium]
MPPPQILLHTPDFLIVEKPAPLLVHPTRPDHEPTLWHWLRERFPDESIALVNRLDRETSGLILASRHPVAASVLGKLIMRRKIEKEYLALCLGCPSQTMGRIDAPIDRLSKYRPQAIHIKRGVYPSGKSALTLYEVIASRVHPVLGLISQLRLFPQTGRLHQIRVHLAHLGHPVVGDKLYGPDETLYLDMINSGWTERHDRLLYCRRHALHASSLRFLWGEQETHVTSPLPADLAAVWQEAGG